MILRVPDSATARRLRGFFADCAYDEQALSRLLGRSSPIYPSSDERRRDSEQLRVSGAVGTLVELFFLEHSVPAVDYPARLPQPVREDLAAVGLTVDDGDSVRASALLVPVGKLLVAGDRHVKLPQDKLAEHVLSVNPPARLLVNFALRQPAPRLLDLCTGNGVQALAVADQAQEVVATDLNPRALDFARFNAALNNVSNIDLRLGAGFEPVCDERFDQIICNPPYILTPSKRFMCTDNNMELDGFCRSLLTQSPTYLREGGVLQMICEWVETEEQDWRARLLEWFVANGCDVWVICAGYSSIGEYAKKRSQQTLINTDSPDKDLSQGWLDYFRKHGVTGIRSGFIQLRRRQGRNWRSITSLGDRVRGAMGASVMTGFRSRDKYLDLDDPGILALRPLPVASLVELKPDKPAGGAVRLLNTSGLPVSFVASPAVRSMLQKMDGSRSVASVSDSAAQAAGIPLQDVRRECCAVVRELLSQGLLQA